MITFNWDFRSLGVRKNYITRNAFAKKEKNIRLHKIIRFNKRNTVELFYKLKHANHNYESISKQTNVCFFTGRNRGVINYGRFKRQIFKRNLMNNMISMIKKKA